MAESNRMRPLVIKFPEELIDRIDAQLKIIQEQNRGIRISRADVIRRLIEIGLESQTAQDRD